MVKRPHIAWNKDIRDDPTDAEAFTKQEVTPSITFNGWKEQGNRRTGNFLIISYNNRGSFTILKVTTHKQELQETCPSFVCNLYNRL